MFGAPFITHIGVFAAPWKCPRKGVIVMFRKYSALVLAWACRVASACERHEHVRRCESRLEAQSLNHRWR